MYFSTKIRKFYVRSWYYSAASDYNLIHPESDSTEIGNFSMTHIHTVYMYLVYAE